MKYYAIVNRIKDEHKSGIYGRKKLNESELKELSKQLKRDTIIDAAIDIALYGIPLIGLPALVGKKLFQTFKKKSSNDKIIFQKSITSENKTIIIPNSGLKNNYDLEDEYSYGLLDELPNKKNHLKR
jgi:hypothetical protein